MKPLIALFAVLLAAVHTPTTSESGTTAMQLKLDRSAPAANAELSQSPAEIRLWFSLRPELAVSMIRVEGETGVVEVGDLTAGSEKDLVVPLTSTLPGGAYTVTWRTSSGDGHPIRGSFRFTVAGS